MASSDPIVFGVGLCQTTGLFANAGRIEIADTHVLITKEEHKRLLTSDRKLNALEAGGVDNWEWYGDSLRDAGFYDDDDDDNGIDLPDSLGG